MGFLVNFVTSTNNKHMLHIAYPRDKYGVYKKSYFCEMFSWCAFAPIEPPNTENAETFYYSQGYNRTNLSLF